MLACARSCVRVCGVLTCSRDCCACTIMCAWLCCKGLQQVVCKDRFDALSGRLLSSGVQGSVWQPDHPLLRLLSTSCTHVCGHRRMLRGWAASGRSRRLRECCIAERAHCPAALSMIVGISIRSVIQHSRSIVRPLAHATSDAACWGGIRRC